ncbi:MAG TPA: hypothetical protein VK642_12405, partial [Burkholderiales bacterium]|nr:hypothetical protein [Burkholderiales bacterium]
RQVEASQTGDEPPRGQYCEIGQRLHKHRQRIAVRHAATLHPESQQKHGCKKSEYGVDDKNKRFAKHNKIFNKNKYLCYVSSSASAQLIAQFA